MTYRVLLAFHVVSIVCWMAGILYLIRLFVYHAAETEAVVKARFTIMEERLYRYITFPAMVSSLFFGGAMLFQRPELFGFSWMQLKLVVVLFLMLLTLYSGRTVASFAREKNVRSEVFFRFLNEIPTLLMLAIIFLVILKVEVY